MNTAWSRKPSVGHRLLAGATAGVIAAVAYVVEQEADLRLFRHNADDLALLGRIVTDNPALVRPVGLGMHLVNGAGAGAAYALLARDRLPGPSWARGTMAALIENTSLYPLALLEGRHPGIREGRIASYQTLTAFVQATIRHIVFGAVLGTLTERMLRARR